MWHNWSAWEQFIDWAALYGVNNMLALTGQEEVQYGVFAQLGIDDATIRGWFNGPAYLTWSRGQNSHGNSIVRAWVCDIAVVATSCSPGLASRRGRCLGHGCVPRPCSAQTSQAAIEISALQGRCASQPLRDYCSVSDTSRGLSILAASRLSRKCSMGSSGSARGPQHYTSKHGALPAHLI